MSVCKIHARVEEFFSDVAVVIVSNHWQFLVGVGFNCIHVNSWMPCSIFVLKFAKCAMDHVALRRSAAFSMEARSGGCWLLVYVIGSCGKGSNMLSEHSSEE